MRALALIVFAISVVSVPLLMMQQVDAVTAVATSVSAVRNNLRPMLLWAGLIAGFMTVGLASLFLGLVLIFPLLGYATWHAFRGVVRPSRPATCERADLALAVLRPQGCAIPHLQVIKLPGLERPEKGGQSRPAQATARRG